MFKNIQGKEKYRGVFEIQRSGDKTSSGEIGLDIRTHASPKVGQDQVSGGVRVLCWHAAPVAYVLWKQITNNYHFITKLNILLNISRNMRKYVKKIGFSPKIKAFHIF